MPPRAYALAEQAARYAPEQGRLCGSSATTNVVDESSDLATKPTTRSSTTKPGIANPPAPSPAGKRSNSSYESTSSEESGELEDCPFEKGPNVRFEEPEPIYTSGEKVNVEDVVKALEGRACSIMEEDWLEGSQFTTPYKTLLDICYSHTLFTQIHARKVMLVLLLSMMLLTAHATCEINDYGFQGNLTKGPTDLANIQLASRAEKYGRLDSTVTVITATTNSTPTIELLSPTSESVTLNDITTTEQRASFN
ncbi:hypothetical protein Dda_0978 [Drechslerella dactyloides]|uniref:Uncharacterized protein n=1 Tax=Drechslerella dactyloides TaxID=74499 RepID=A0AAD6J8F4_DREDA|nr:hypothetical protein Dda_0978 [Drechslerella dactyloides]